MFLYAVYYCFDNLYLFSYFMQVQNYIIPSMRFYALAFLFRIQYWNWSYWRPFVDWLTYAYWIRKYCLWMLTCKILVFSRFFHL